MAWIKAYSRFGPLLVLGLLIGALLGPWIIGDRIHVPAPYFCDPPYIRLDGDFCGLPYTGLRVLGLGGWVIAGIVEGLLSASIGPGDVLTALVILALMLLLLLPYAITLLRILTANQRPGQQLALAGWGLAAGAGVLVIVLDPWQPAHLLWGLWLLTGLALVMLVVEALRLRFARRALGV